MPQRSRTQCPICGYYRHSKYSSCINAKQINSNYWIQSRPVPSPTNINQPININKNIDNLDTTLSPLTTKSNYRDAVAKLAPISELITEKIFLGDKSILFKFVGPCVRDAVFGDVVDEYYIEIVGDFSYQLQSSYTFFAKLFSNYLQQFNAVGINPTNYKVLLQSNYGPLVININFKSEYAAEWNYDDISYQYNSGILFNYSQIIEQTKSIQLVNKYTKYTDPKATLEYGLKVAQKYDWALEQSSIELLIKQIEANQPPPEVNEVFIGFRAYNIENGYLKGQHGVRWESKELTVDCPDFVEHIKDANSDWRHGGQGSTEKCGIYIHKDPAVCLYEIPNAMAIAMVYAYGVVGDFEKGYRAEHCEIKRLWVLRQDKDGRNVAPTLKPGIYDCEIMVDVRASDFLYDDEVRQWAGRNSGH